MKAHRWDAEPIGYWRPHARSVIEAVYAACRADGLDADATLARIDAAYPFGPREHHPYVVWLDERRRIRVRLGLIPDPRGDERGLTRERRIALGQLEMELVA